MKSTIYRRGREKEYKLCRDERKKGNLAFRSAGSHSPIDIISIDAINKKIYLIQSKRVFSETMSFTPQKLKEKLEAEHLELNGTFQVSFEVR